MYSWDRVKQIEAGLQSALEALLDGRDRDLGQLSHASIEQFLIEYLRPYPRVTLETPESAGVPNIDHDDTLFFYIKFDTDYMVTLAINQSLTPGFRSPRPDYLTITRDVIAGVGSCAISLPTP